MRGKCALGLPAVQTVNGVGTGRGAVTVDDLGAEEEACDVMLAGFVTAALFLIIQCVEKRVDSRKGRK